MQTNEADWISSVIQGLTAMREDISPLPRVFRYYDTRDRGIRDTAVTAPAKPAGFIIFYSHTREIPAGLSPSPCKTIVYTVRFTIISFLYGYIVETHLTTYYQLM
jgi:hypothetical protein